MQYISVFIVPLFLAMFIWFMYGKRDSYRKAKESLLLTIGFIALLLAGSFFLANSSTEDWILSNVFSYIAVIGVIIAMITILTFNQNKIKKYASDFQVLEQETMYDTGVSLDSAYAHRVIKYSDGKASKLTTESIDLDVVDKQKEILPHLQKEILDIINNKNTIFYEYGLTQINPKKRDVKKVEKSLSKFYKGVIGVAQANLKHFDMVIPFEEALKLNDYVVEYAVMYILERAKEIKNTPMGNLGSLVSGPQDEHMHGACGSLGFTSVGRYGIAIFVGYKLLWHDKKNKKQERT